ncbi:MAG: PP2C family serine/threonine-protein phosphatase, partial [Chloroflexota bacterium]
MKQIEDNAVSSYLVSFGTHEGMVGKNNEDFVAFAAFDSGVDDVEVPEIFHLGIVADGVGGQIAGERASKLATQTIVDYFADLESIQIEQVLVHLDKAISLANQTLIEESSETPEYKGMATTVAIVVILDGLLFTSHVGDSRVYLQRNGELYQLTNDHSWVQEALEAGIINVEEARKHPNRNIIRRSLGTMENVAVDQVMMSGQDSHFWQGMPLRKDDLLLICSDGLTDMISEYDVMATLEDKQSEVSEKVSELIDKANQAGGRDNTSVMLIKTAEDFKPNRLMPIAPSLKPTIHRSILGPESETITFVGKAIDRNTFAAPTVRSMPRVSSDMIRSHKRTGRAQLAVIGDLPTIKSTSPTIQASAHNHVSHSAKTVKTEWDKVKNGHQSNQQSIPGNNEAVQRLLIRIVVTLASIAVALLIIVFLMRNFL